MRNLFKNIEWKQWGKIALVIIPVLIWDVFFLLVTKIYNLCVTIDKKGEVVLNNFMEIK